jgi:hypothetical protein
LFVFIFSLISFLFYFEGKLPPLQECRSCRGGIGIAELFRLSSFDPYPPGVLLVAFRAVAIVSGGSPRVTEQENVVHIVPVRPVFRPRYCHALIDLRCTYFVLVFDVLEGDSCEIEIVLPVA